MFSISFIISIDFKLVAVAVNSNSPNTFKIEKYTLFCKILYLLCKLNIVIKKMDKSRNKLAHSLAPFAKRRKDPIFVFSF